MSLAHSVALSQVTIRDKIIIGPRIFRILNSNRTLTADFTWSGDLSTLDPCDPFHQIHYNILALANSQCNLYQQTNVDNGEGSVSLSSTLSGVYHISTYLNTVSSGTGTWHVYLDGNQIDQFTSSRDPSPCLSIGGVDHEVDIQSTIHISAGLQNIFHGNSNSFNLGPGNFDVCLPHAWSPVIDLIKLEITDGQAYGNFYHSDGTLIGSNYTASLSDISTLGCYFKADGIQPCGASANVTVTASVPVAGISEGTSFSVLCSLQPAIYHQIDTPWNADIYDHDPKYKHISSKGCALTSLANAMNAFGVSINPRDLNNWLNNDHRNGYVGGSIDWDKIRLYSGQRVFAERSSNFSFDHSVNGGPNFSNLSDLDAPLNSCKLVIVQVYNPTRKDQHWVLVTKKESNGEYSIIDPGYPSRTSLNDQAYGNKFWGSVIISSCQ